MKLLLTSAGFTNKKIVNALKDLVDRPFNQLKLAFIPTAANTVKGDKGWLIEDMHICTQLGFSQVDMVDIAATPKNVFLPRLEEADILFFGGGDTPYLMKVIKETGLDKEIPRWLKNKVYVGLSAGSCIASKRGYGEYDEILYSEPTESKYYDCLGLVDFYIVPHLNSLDFPNLRIENIERVARELKETVFALDDNSAVKYVDGSIEMISEGICKKYN